MKEEERSNIDEELNKKSKGKSISSNELLGRNFSEIYNKLKQGD